ncbi:DUF2957 domain-containing protein [Burkholderia sp. ISTR5]|nr:DUF2957 domain-containing protein [Burkholderia sp. ISTR5]
MKGMRRRRSACVDRALVDIYILETGVLESKRKIAFGFLLIPLLVACGGGDGEAPASIAAPQCAAGNCGPRGAPVSLPAAKQTPLCPDDPDIGRSTYTGGAGSGEILSLKIDAIAMRYELKWFESPIPMTTGTVAPTRAGVTITGEVRHPAPGYLATAEQRRCAFVLMPGKGSSAKTQTAYSTKETFNAANPPTIFVGFGVAGGGIPGAALQFDGQSMTKLVQSRPNFLDALGFLGDSVVIDDFFSAFKQSLNLFRVFDKDLYERKMTDLSKIFDYIKSDDFKKIIKALRDRDLPARIPVSVGRVDSRIFEFYQFIGFSKISPLLSDLRGDYNGFVYHVNPSSGYAVGSTNFSEKFDGQGGCLAVNFDRMAVFSPSEAGCVSSGEKWTEGSLGYFSSLTSPQVGRVFKLSFDEKNLRKISEVLESLKEMMSNWLQVYGNAYRLSEDENERRIFESVIKIFNLFDVLKKFLADLPGQSSPRKIASSHMVLGQLNGKTIPIIVRTGVVNPGSAAKSYLDAEVDDESGIAILAPAEAAPASMLDGHYIGADSNFNYTATYFKGLAGIFSDPMSLKPRDRATLNPDDQAHGLIGISLVDQPKVTGHLISVGGIYAALINGTVNGGVSGSASKFGTPPYILSAESAPYFVIGAKVGQ